MSANHDRIEKLAFAQGHGIAVATIVNLHDKPDIALDVLREGGLTFQDYVASGLTEYDLRPLRALFREMARLRACARRRSKASPSPTDTRDAGRDLREVGA